MNRRIIFPPSLSMNEYADHVEATIKSIDPVNREKQKKIEEQIHRAFSLKDSSKRHINDKKPAGDL